ncbi:short-chain fatty acid transporter [Paraburkholderia caballeronis]|uniref:Short-chain fatty acids transporter n=1 Tax=Paraburkholderia caballeronis TaxID=416943 RepID=A0A1H7U120_9BURK|nr:TIGR00366 family protein [Paraburkholderia caballeronis]PXW23450.1 short-chain fatty acids transporter [Paraburkholderia caballeronis]PXW98443.1 short-chain fatty acids transporter [Paraburkholderia caballeronis]RAJ95174.1 short-chain fatty acids transporter [Paraburkholderia caballeronis]TDV09520.1 short-chain fatty acids transporter [Paraburkholderia caballeronis]TDV13791.1 short-chain fatty acids transporter [Paraburkholderia caballeronis]
MEQRQPLASAARGRDGGRGVVAGLVYVFEQVMPDPFVLSIGLTFVVCVLAAVFGPHATLPTILTAWYNGTFNILGFALQMILILATGFAIADAPLVQRGLRAMAAHASTPTRAALMVFPIVAVAAWLNWGLGLIVGALLSREIAKRVKVDFAWLVAGSYSAWSICNSGLSSSIALSQASHGNALNLVEKATGHVVPLTDTVFAPFVFVPSVLVVVVMTAIFIRMHPKPDDVVPFSEPAAAEGGAANADPHARGAAPTSFAARAERSVLGTLLLVALGVGYLAMTWRDKGFELDINTTILIFLLIGLVLQGRPIAYADAIRRAARQTGSMLLQYPVYGGIMGIMTGTGLASTIAKTFVAIATPATLPVWSFLSSAIITLLIPSAGGHWAVQGPFVLPAALDLHASVARTAMGVAMAENVSNMLQPFWAVPVVAIAGIRIQRVMGYTAITFVVSLVIYAAALWLIP